MCFGVHTPTQGVKADGTDSPWWCWMGQEGTSFSLGLQLPVVPVVVEGSELNLKRLLTAEKKCFIFCTQM